MSNFKCICGQQTGRICPAHPNRVVELSGINGPTLPAGTEIPYADEQDAVALDAAWNDELAARNQDIIEKQNANKTASAAFDRVFAMSPEQLGQAAVDEARLTQRTPDCPDCRPGFPYQAHAGSY